MVSLILLLPLPALAEEASSHQALDLNFLESILAANIIVQITFAVLLIMSIVSWAVIFQKWMLFKNIEKENLYLQDIFLKTSSFEEIYTTARSHEDSSLSQIFCGGYNEMQKLLKAQKNLEQNSQVQLRGLDNIERALRKEVENEISLLEQGLIFLATTGNSCPFIGLFGTVFGIMDAFSKIAVMGSASLTVVAPGIAEALIATGFGLFAAIPASIFYNTFINKIKKYELELNNFSTDFLNISKRNFFQGE